ncbi:MAG: hypothetical protein KIT69_20780, partial [Propionibacteriaceae bacterium]|nr:hypothetical protein [Propionibacteriaceae bacterium]
YEITVNLNVNTQASTTPTDGSYYIVISGTRMKDAFIDCNPKGSMAGTSPWSYNINLFWAGPCLAGQFVVIVNAINGWTITANDPTLGINQTSIYIKRVAPNLDTQLSGTANQIQLSNSVFGFPSQVIFPTNAPQCAIPPSIGDSLTNLTAVQNLFLSSYGQSDYITTQLNTKYPNTRHIWYNANLVAGGVSMFVNNGETIPAIEITITTKPTMPQWPVYIWSDAGGGLTIQDFSWFMLPPPGTTKTYTRLFTQGAGNRTTPAGTYRSLWDGSNNVIASPVNVQSPTGNTGDTFGLSFTYFVQLTSGQLVESYDPLIGGSINLVTSPSSSAYFSAIQMRARY